MPHDLSRLRLFLPLFSVLLLRTVSVASLKGRAQGITAITR
jgi:hypothetical protein